jgi:hypothetical protein
MLSEIFSIPFLICLSISVLLIGCSSIYFYQRITQQDHKIESMVSLISSMAEELKGGQPPVKAFVPLPVHAPIMESMSASTLIPVSDGEESESESEESDSESGEETSTYSDSDEEEMIEIMGSVEDLKESEIEELEMEKIDISEMEEEPDNIKSIHLDDSLGSLNDLSLFKSIHISGSDTEIQNDSITIEESTNYKKMPIQKLREIVQLQGHGDVSKLKKNELLKLLGVE